MCLDRDKTLQLHLNPGSCPPGTKETRGSEKAGALGEWRGTSGHSRRPEGPQSPEQRAVAVVEEGCWGCWVSRPGRWSALSRESEH